MAGNVRLNSIPWKLIALQNYSNISFVNDDVHSLLLESSALVTDISSVIVDYLAAFDTYFLS